MVRQLVKLDHIFHWSPDIRLIFMPGLPSSLLETVRRILFYSWINVLLLFVPVGIITYLTQGGPYLVFTSNALAVIPLSGLLTMATECIAREMGDSIGALLNISFGNLVELIIL